MSLKKTVNSRISKKRSKLPQITSLKSQLFLTSNDEVVTEKTRTDKYRPLEFSKNGSSNGSKLYLNQQKCKKHSEITIIPETDTEGEGEEINQKPNKKIATMAELFQPKVKLTDVINLCSDSDNNT